MFLCDRLLLGIVLRCPSLDNSCFTFLRRKQHHGGREEARARSTSRANGRTKNAWAKKATEDLLRTPGFNERLFEYVRTLPPEHSVAIARMDFSMLTPTEGK